jgi:hypothetical protein
MMDGSKGTRKGMAQFPAFLFTIYYPPADPVPNSLLLPAIQHEMEIQPPFFS